MITPASPQTNNNAQFESAPDVPTRWSREKKIAWLLAYAWKCRNRFAPPPSYSDISSDDLYGVIAIAVTQAVDEYNPSRNTKLTTYAIRRARYAALEAYRLYSHSTRSMRDKGKFVQWLSMNTPYGTGSTLGAMLDDTCPDPDADTFSAVAHHLDVAQLHQYISRLNEREQFVVRGILADISFIEIAKTLQLSESSIYQLMSKSVNKLKGMASMDLLKERQWEHLICA